MEKVLVSIKCMVYNHESFLRQCLDGFIMQKTNFRFEAIVHDDCSTDKSAEILREYAEKYPEIIKPIYETENQYSKNDGSLNRILYSHLSGKYIALCEGDDYWTDPYKLQKQVDFLESHPDYVLTTHLCRRYNQEKEEWGAFLPLDIERDFDYDLNYFIQRKQWVTQTLTAVYRRSALDLDNYYLYQNAKDVTLFYNLLKRGKGRYMNDCMAVYRIHGDGVWSQVGIPQQYAADLRTYIGIYNVDKDANAVNALKSRLETMGYVGFNFLKKYWRLYLESLSILKNHLGYFATLKLLLRSLNYFHVYWGY